MMPRPLQLRPQRARPTPSAPFGAALGATARAAFTSPPRASRGTAGLRLLQDVPATGLRTREPVLRVVSEMLG